MLLKPAVLKSLLAVFAAGILLLLSTLPGNAVLVQQDFHDLTMMEQTLFTSVYLNEPPEARLNRVEKVVFGYARNGSPPEERLNKLRAVLFSAKGIAKPSPEDLKPLQKQPEVTVPAVKTGSTMAQTKDPKLEAEPKPPATDQKAVKQASSKTAKQSGKQAARVTPAAGEPSASQPASMEYPTLEAIEKRLFGKTYEKEDITHRLGRAEFRVFGVVHQGSLMERMDHLRLSVFGLIPPAALANNDYPVAAQPAAGQQPTNPSAGGAPPQQINQPIFGDTPDYNLADQQSIAASSGTSPMSSGSDNAENDGLSSADLVSALNDVELEVLHQSYPADPLPARLDRLEMKIFNATAPELSEGERFERIVGVASTENASGGRSSTKTNVKRSLIPLIFMLIPLLL